MASSSSPPIIALEDFTEGIKFCLYADSGIGKTVFAGTARTLFLAFKAENGTISAKRQGSKGKVWKIRKWDDLQDAYDWIYDNPDVFEWICIDSVTAMQKLAMRSVLDAAVADNPTRDLDLPALQDWQKYYNMFDRFIAAFNDLPCNVIYLATVMQNENPDGEEIVMPNLAGRGGGYSISQGFCASLGIVGYMRKDVKKASNGELKVTRRILFENLPPYFAKDRYGVLPRYMTTTVEDRTVMTLEKFTELINNSGTKSKTAAKKAPAKAPVKAVPARRPPVRSK